MLGIIIMQDILHRQIIMQDIGIIPRILNFKRQEPYSGFLPFPITILTLSRFFALSRAFCNAPLSFPYFSANKHYTPKQHRIKGYDE